jgi:replication factor C large subunit
MSHLDLDPGLVLLWINENLPGEYKDLNDLVKGYNALSKADIFLGRTYKKQNYGLWAYSCDIMNGGVATAKTHVYPNDRYAFPTWIRQKKGIKNNIDAKNSIVSKLSKDTHNSIKKSNKFLMNYFIHMFRNDTDFAIKMKKRYDLSESEIKFLLGEKQLDKLKEIMQSKPIIEKTEDNIKEKIIIEKEEKAQQQSLFDF